MNYLLYEYAKAYQEDLLRKHNQNGLRTRREGYGKRHYGILTQKITLLQRRINNRLGDILISLGEKVKGEPQRELACSEISQGHA